ncbi:unnamed protein product, partial [Ectocarpus sp. 6 AP-2014]
LTPRTKHTWSKSPPLRNTPVRKKADRPPPPTSTGNLKLRCPRRACFEYRQRRKKVPQSRTSRQTHSIGLLLQPRVPSRKENGAIRRGLGSRWHLQEAAVRRAREFLWVFQTVDGFPQQPKGSTT